MVELSGPQFGGQLRIDHIVVTQLNTRHKQGLNTDRDWLTERVELFRKYAVPSVVRQKSADFMWWVYIDLHTDDDLVMDIEKSLDGLPCKLIATVEKFGEEMLSQDLVNEYWRENPDPPDFVATTRLDSDDMLAQGFCENLYAQMTLQLANKTDEEKSRCIEYMNGVRYSDRLGVGLSSQASGGRFRTVVAPYNENWMDNCYTIPPRKLVKTIRCSPMWMKVVHGRNCLEKATASKSDTKVSGKVLAEAFDVGQG